MHLREGRQAHTAYQRIEEKGMFQTLHEVLSYEWRMADIRRLLTSYFARFDLHQSAPTETTHQDRDNPIAGMPSINKTYGSSHKQTNLPPIKAHDNIASDRKRDSIEIIN
jgi:hypothetical protein